MLRSKMLAAVLASTLMLGSVQPSTAGVVVVPPPPVQHSNPVALWLIFGCVGGVLLAAAVANAHENRELNTAEATTCGLLYWLRAQPRR